MTATVAMAASSRHQMHGTGDQLGAAYVRVTPDALPCKHFQGLQVHMHPGLNHTVCLKWGVGLYTWQGHHVQEWQLYM